MRCLLPQANFGVRDWMGRVQDVQVRLHGMQLTQHGTCIPEQSSAGNTREACELQLACVA